MGLLRKINQILGAAEKNQEKVKGIYTSFSVLASQSVESSFAGKTNVDNFLPEFDMPIHGLFKSLRL